MNCASVPSPPAPAFPPPPPAFAPPPTTCLAPPASSVHSRPPPSLPWHPTPPAPPRRRPATSAPPRPPTVLRVFHKQNFGVFHSPTDPPFPPPVKVHHAPVDPRPQDLQQVIGQHERVVPVRVIQSQRRVQAPRHQ